MNVYVLKLENEKYYIGKTNNITRRINEHHSNQGSSWTKKYKPIETVEIKESCDEYEETKTTIEYMKKYGIDNVRGGPFCQIILRYDDKRMIKKLINDSNNQCYKCGESDHYANKCPLVICFRCGRTGHIKPRCYAKTSIDGNILDIESDDESSDEWNYKPIVSVISSAFSFIKNYL